MWGAIDSSGAFMVTTRRGREGGGGQGESTGRRILMSCRVHACMYACSYSCIHDRCCKRDRVYIGMQANLKTGLSCPKGPDAVHMSSKLVDPEPAQNTQKTAAGDTQDEACGVVW